MEQTNANKRLSTVSQSLYRHSWLQLAIIPAWIELRTIHVNLCNLYIRSDTITKDNTLKIPLPRLSKCIKLKVKVGRASVLRIIIIIAKLHSPHFIKLQYTWNLNSIRKMIGLPCMMYHGAISLYRFLTNDQILEWTELKRSLILRDR